MAIRNNKVECLIMKANKFVKKHGWEAVAHAIKKTPENNDFKSTD